MSRLALAALFLLAGCGPPCGPRSATVARVVDGDTIDLVGLATKTRVRLLSVDAPEITSGKHECYGQQAADFTTAQLLGKVAHLAYDVECTDRYGRTLASVSVGDSKGQTQVNTELVRRGYACARALGAAGSERAEAFATFEAEARTERRGMWGVCVEVPCASRD